MSKIHRRLLRDSNPSSRAESRTRTPAEDDSDYEEDTETDFKRLQEYLNSKLASLAQVVHDEPLINGIDKTDMKDRKQHNVLQLSKQRVQSDSTTFNEIVFSLGRPRTEVSTNSRELLLAQLYKIIASKPLLVYNEEHAGTKDYIDENTVGELVGLFMNGAYRTEQEFYYLLRCVVATVLSDMDEWSQFVTGGLFAHLQDLVDAAPSSSVTNTNKAHVLTAYAALVLVLQHGSSSFGVDERIVWLLDRAEASAITVAELRRSLNTGDREYSTLFDKNNDKALVSDAWARVASEEAVAAAALHATAVLLTLLEKGSFTNDIVQDVVDRMVPMLENEESRDVAKAAGRVTAVAYEMYVYADEDDEDDDADFNTNAPYYEQESLFAALDRLANLSSKRVAKKDKKDFHSVFRNILYTLQAYTDSNRRKEIFKGSQEGKEIMEEILDGAVIRLGRHRAMPIDSWGLHMRLRVLKWVFSFGLHNQLVANSNVKDVLKKEESEFVRVESDEEEREERVGRVKVGRGEDRGRRIRRERVEKMVQQMEDVGL